MIRNAVYLPAVLAIIPISVMYGCASGPPKDEPPNSLVSRSVSVGEASHRYAVWIPPGYDPQKAWPCVVFLHGSGECGEDGLKQATVGLGPAAKADPSQWPCIVVMPQKPREQVQWEEFEPLVLGALAQARHEFNVDPTRVSITGLSQGGHGAWIIGARHPELWSAVAPICGYGDPAALAGLAGKPVWAFHGEQDHVVPFEQSRNLIDTLQRMSAARAGSEVPRLTLYPDLGHNCWDRAYRDAGLGPWLLAQHSH